MFVQSLTLTSSWCSQFILNMGEDDPRRMEEIRKYAAIYGRFDCKRKPEKPLTLHEVGFLSDFTFLQVETGVTFTNALACI